MSDSGAPLLCIRNLKTYFQTRQGLVKAVDGVDLEVQRGESLGVVGESGSGKSVALASVMGLIRHPGWIEDGSIMFDGRELTTLSPKEMRRVRGKEIAMTLQDALTALNPALTVGNQIAEAIHEHDVARLPRDKSRRQAVRERAIDMMRLVGLPSAETRLKDYPHQFSGGMRQRIMIAIALSCRPKLLIADEPTTALDVTIQAQVLDLIDDLRRELGMSVIVITHDLGVVAEYCERVAVMYAGQVVESGTTRQVIAAPAHPYTRGLLASIPKLSHLDEPIHAIDGQVPELVDLPAECRFYSRCEQRSEACRRPIAMIHRRDGRGVRCINAAGELAA